MTSVREKLTLGLFSKGGYPIVLNPISYGWGLIYPSHNLSSDNTRALKGKVRSLITNNILFKGCPL